MNNSSNSSLNASPEDNRPTMVSVENVSMVFNIASEQLNNLKEYAIAIARRELMFKEFRALQGVSFEIKKGDVFGILGTNGSGKSTMMKIIAGVLEPTEGTCTVNGNIAPLIELGAGFDMELTARENIFLNGALLGYSRPFIQEHFDEIVSFAEVENFLDMPLKNYSSGMVARIAFAIATVIVPEILLVDEVLSVGDFMFQKKCEDRIKELIDKHGVTVLIVSHSNDQISRLCNKAIWIEKGHTQIQGNAQKVCRIYGTLGGRKGTPESEAYILEKLEGLFSGHDFDPTRLFCGNPHDVNVTLARFNNQNYVSDTVVVASNATLINSSFAASFAGALSTVSLTTNIDSIPTSTENELYRLRPRRIIFIDCGASAKAAVSQIADLPWNPEIIDLSGTGDTFQYSINLIQYGRDNHLWGNELFFVDFSDELESIAISPLLYKLNAPLFITNKRSTEDAHNCASEIPEVLSNWSFGKVTVIGPSFPEADSLLHSCEIKASHVATSDDMHVRMQQLTELMISYCEETDPIRTILIGSTSPSQRLYLNGAHNLLKNDGVLLLVDVSTFDTMRSCLHFLEQHNKVLSNVVFYGSENGFFLDDCKILEASTRPD